jgi:hypothetical protein
MHIFVMQCCLADRAVMSLSPFTIQSASTLEGISPISLRPDKSWLKSAPLLFSITASHSYVIDFENRSIQSWKRAISSLINIRSWTKVTLLWTKPIQSEQRRLEFEEFGAGFSSLL